MINAGIVGLGFMGATHLGVYRSMPDRVRVAAIVEPDPKKRAGDLSGTAGNIDAGERPSLDGIRMLERLDDLLADDGIDLVDITLPTFLHRDAVLKALAAGKHVICEKPMALLPEEADEMVRAADASGRLLFIGQCVRFWPAYARAREIMLGGEFGAVRTAAFSRLSAIPGWVWQNWVTRQDKSGGAPLDLHIHDADFISHVFGRPPAVTAFVGGRRGGAADGALDHILACYHYPGDMLVTAVGAWEYAAGHPFSMTFDVHMDGGTLTLSPDGALTLYRDGRSAEVLSLPAGDGWTHELRHFVDCAERGVPSSVVSPGDAAFSVRLVHAEIASARTGRRVEV